MPSLQVHAQERPEAGLNVSEEEVHRAQRPQGALEFRGVVADRRQHVWLIIVQGSDLLCQRSFGWPDLARHDSLMWERSSPLGGPTTTTPVTTLIAVPLAKGDRAGRTPRWTNLVSMFTDQSEANLKTAT